MKLYRGFSIGAAVVFGVVGILFLFFPDPVLAFFNRLSGVFRLPEAPLSATNFYLALAAAFMYLVTVLAGKMYRHPEEKIYAVLLIHGKTASSLISLFLFITHRHYLIYIGNFLVDGFIAIMVVLMLARMKR